MRIAPVLAVAALAAIALGDVRSADESAWPAWRKAMTQPNTIYDISDNAIKDLKFDFGGAKIPTQFGNSDDGGQGTGGSIYGYGGGAHFRGVGKHGVVVFGSGGENFAGNMTGALHLDGAKARFEIWQQPVYRTKAEPGAEFYFNPKEAEALPEARRFPHLKFDKSRWDGGFPLAIGGWVYPAPVKFVEPAAGMPLGKYRYDQHCYLPAEATGLGTGVWFIPNAHFMAPGFYYGIDMALCTDFWPSGKKKWYSHYQREDTKAWAHLPTPAPEVVGPAGFSTQVVGYSAKRKQVVVPAQGPRAETGVFDLAEGLAKATWSVKASPKKGTGDVHIRCGQKSALSNGHPRDRAFFVWYTGPYGAAPNGLNILDLDDPAYPVHVVKRADLKGSGERIGLHYLPKLNKFVSFCITGNPAVATCQLISIPDDLADTAAYRVEDFPLALAAGVDLATSYTNSGMVQFVESLDCIVFMAVGRSAKAFWVKAE